MDHDEVRAKVFKIVDDDGKVVGAFGAQDGRPVLTLFDPEDKGRQIIATIDGNGPVINIHNAEFDHAISIRSLKDQRGIFIFDQKNRPRLFAGVGTKGLADVQLFDEKGEITHSVRFADKE